MQSRNTLSLFGGKPILKKSFPPYNSIGKAEKRAVMAVMDRKILSGFIARAGDKFLGGEYVRKLEQLFSKLFKVRYAVSYNSATTALQGAVAALGIGPGDEVITTPYSMSATPISILLNGAIPVFADIEKDYFCLDPKSIEKKITKKTKAILLVNLFGGAVDFSKIKTLAKKYNLKIIEDNAQSIGARYQKKYLGTIGDIGVFSFNQNKTLHSGEGGVLVTNSKKLAFRSQLIRNHGEAVINDLYKTQGIYEPIIGSNYRLTELNAAVAYEQLKKIKKFNAPRAVLARYLTQQLQRFRWLEPPLVRANSTHVYFIYPFKFFEKKIGIKRKTFALAMKAEGFPLGEGYVQPLYRMPLFQRREIYPRTRFPFTNSNIRYRKGICPVTERMFEKELLFTLICTHKNTKKDINLFVNAVKKVEKNVDTLKAYEKKKSN